MALFFNLPIILLYYNIFYFNYALIFLYCLIVKDLLRSLSFNGGGD